MTIDASLIGGLLFSRFMTLVFLPCAYVVMPGRRRHGGVEGEAQGPDAAV